MQRTQISLNDTERRLLDAEASRTGRSLSALIRDAVMQTYGTQASEADDLRAIDAARGTWRERDVDGEQYVEALRSGRRLDRLAER